MSPRLPLLLAALVGCAVSQSTRAGDNLAAADRLDRARPGLASAGPAGLPREASRKADQNVEPASFVGARDARPLRAQSLWLDSEADESSALPPRPSSPASGPAEALLPDPEKKLFTTRLREEALAAPAMTPRGPSAISPPTDGPSHVVPSGGSKSVAARPADPVMPDFDSDTLFDQAASPAAAAIDAPPPMVAAEQMSQSAAAGALSVAPAPPALPSPVEASPSSDGRAANGRKLGDPQRRAAASRGDVNPLAGILAWRPSPSVITSVGSALAVVVGLLLCAAWIVRQSLPRSSRPVPAEVAEVLGRVPLGGKQQAHLIRLGRKLVLLTITPDGVEKLAEEDDAAEVQRLVAMCETERGRGSAADFDAVFRQMAGEPTQPGFLGADGLDYDPRRLAEAYSFTPGGRARAA